MTSPPPQLVQRLVNDVGAHMGWPEGGASGLRAWLKMPHLDRPAEPYDLASTEFDLPPADAERSLVIATGYRSGSTLVAEGLTTAGSYGVPLEYLQKGAMERKFTRFASPDPDTYLAAVMRSRTSPTGVLGIKVFWPESEVLHRLPDPVVVRLRRLDVASQAVSTWTALNTGVWRSTSMADSDVPYDRSRLIALVAMHAYHDSCWESALEGSRTIDVTYEALSMDPAATLGSIIGSLEQLGMPPLTPPGAPRLVRQANRTSRQLTARLKQDLMAYRSELPPPALSPLRSGEDVEAQ